MFICHTRYRWVMNTKNHDSLNHYWKSQHESFVSDLFTAKMWILHHDNVKNTHHWLWGGIWYRKASLPLLTHPAALTWHRAFFFFLFLRIKTQLDGHHLALLLIRSHQLWWRHWTILHMKISSTAAKNDSIVRIIVFSSRRLTLMVI